MVFVAIDYEHFLETDPLTEVSSIFYFIFWDILVWFILWRHYPDVFFFVAECKARLVYKRPRSRRVWNGRSKIERQHFRRRASGKWREYRCDVILQLVCSSSLQKMFPLLKTDEKIMCYYDYCITWFAPSFHSDSVNRVSQHSLHLLPHLLSLASASAFASHLCLFALFNVPDAVLL